jgi:hypothetical protein
MLRAIGSRPPPQLHGDLDVQRPLPIAPKTLAHLVSALLALVFLFHPAAAKAQSRANEGAARALEKKAMEDDYLNTDFDKAAEKLNQAIAKCGTDKCGVPVRAQLKRDLAAVQSAAGHKDLALAAMTDAFKIDAGLVLDPNFKTKELEAIYTEAKKAAAGGGASGPPPSGDFTVAPVTEQQVRTPIPIYVDYTGSETLKRVMAKYKGLGMTDWKSLELKSIGSGFGATTACADVQVGDFVYYIQGFNEANDPVASSGDRSNPFHVNVKTDAAGDPPHLPGASPPTQCADNGDCPPGLPGCKGGGGPPAIDTSLKAEGVACEEDNECQSTTCKDMKCTAPPEDTSKPKRRKIWIGIAGSLDLSFLSSAQNVCELYLPPSVGAPTNGNTPPTSLALQGTPTNSKGYYCTQNGADYPTRVSANEAANIAHNSADSVGGGMTPANIRLLASFDYAFTTNMMIGARVGYVLGTYPGSQATHFPPLHIEARYTYVLGEDPIGKAGIHPFILAGGGVSEFDANVSVAVNETGSNDGIKNPQCNATGTARCVDTVSAWQTNGPVFLEVGGGLRWELVPGVAAMLDLKLVGAIGGNGFAFIPTPELGVQFGF